MATITTLRPVTRQQGIQIPNLLPAPEWIDARSLAAGVAKSYALPTDAGGSKGTILGISATSGPLYINFVAAATVTAADVSDGSASIMLRTDAGGSYLLFVPHGTVSVSMICAAACVVTIEVWG